MKWMLYCKVKQGTFDTFRTGGMLRYLGRKGVTEHLDFTEVPTSVF